MDKSARKRRRPHRLGTEEFSRAKTRFPRQQLRFGLLAWGRGRHRRHRRKASSASRSPWLEPAWHEPQVSFKDARHRGRDVRAEIRPQTPILPLAGSGPPADPTTTLLAAAFGPESAPRERTWRPGSGSFRTTFAVGNPYSPLRAARIAGSSTGTGATPP